MSFQEQQRQRKASIFKQSIRFQEVASQVFVQRVPIRYLARLYDDAADEDDSEAIVADSGYTPPTPTPRTKRVIATKKKMDSGWSFDKGTANADAKAPRIESAIVSCSARDRPRQSPT